MTPFCLCLNVAALQFGVVICEKGFTITLPAPKLTSASSVPLQFRTLFINVFSAPDLNSMGNMLPCNSIPGAPFTKMV